MVQRRHIADVEEFPGEPKLLSEETNAIQIFKQREEGETLLILGEPGSGKTTTLLRIAQDLIEQAEKDLGQFIPIVFNLSSWASERQTLADWLVKDLDSKYSVPKEVGKNWISNQELILLLDGLDEVKADQREACIQAINEFINSHSLTEIVVCSRMRDYEALSSRLQIQSAVCLQSLTPEQIDLYLDRAGDQLAGVKALLKEDKELQELARSPLTLSIIALAYQGISAEELPQHSSLEEHRQHLLDAYIERMFRRRGVEKKYPKAQVKYYLSWLAQHLNRSSQSIFLIERMQPSWLLSSEKIYYQIGNVTTFLIAIFLVEILTTYVPKISGIIASTEFTLQHTILMSIAIDFPVGLFLFGFNQKEIKTFETIKSPFHLFGKLTASKIWITTKKILCKSFLYGLIYGVCFAIILGFVFWNNPSFIDETSDSISGLITGIIVGLTTGAIIGIFTGFWGHYVSLSGLFFLLIYGFICLNPSLNVTILKFMEVEPGFPAFLPGGFLGYFMGIIFGILARFGKPESIIFGGLSATGLGLILWVDPEFYKDFFDLSVSSVTEPTLRLLVGLNVGLFVGMLMGLILHWTEGMQGPEVETKIKPNQGIWRSVNSAIFVGIVIALGTGILYGLFGITDPAFNWFSLIFGALGMGAFFGLINGGGQACIRHFTLRFILQRKGNIPWNYAYFLDSACDLIFLQKVGGGYIFVHRLLMEHFAQMNSQKVIRLTTEKN